MEVSSASFPLPAPYRPSGQVLKPATAPRTRPVSGDDIVDCIEIKMDELAPSKGRMTKYSPVDKPQKGKGVFIDLWI